MDISLKMKWMHTILSMFNLYNIFVLENRDTLFWLEAAVNAV